MSRRDLARHPGFAALSPGPGLLDDAAVARSMRDDPDATLAVLADMTGAVDPALRALARRLAGRVVVGHARSGVPRPGPGARLGPAPAGVDGDLDVDASVDAVVAARGEGRAPTVDELVSRRWSRTADAVVLLVDRSGSMGGTRLAGAALAAATVAWRAPREHAVLVFDGGVTVVKELSEPRDAESVVDDLLALRGHGSTDLALALRAGRRALDGAGGARRTVLVLSDCRHNGTGDPVAEAGGIDRLLVLAPADDDVDARAFAASTGARVASYEGPASIPRALVDLLA